MKPHSGGLIIGDKEVKAANVVAPLIDSLLRSGLEPVLLIGIEEGVTLGRVAVAAHSKIPPDVAIRILSSAINSITNASRLGRILHPR